MNPAPNREVALFSAALELPAGERAAYLAENCADDPALRLRLEALLRVHQDAISFLENQASGAPESSRDAELRGALRHLSTFPAEKAGDRIGRYKLLQQIGEGGCGVVYMAEQEEPVRRRVALKVIKLGMDTKQVIARFEAERQALALMDHPNIAKVLDAGATDTGRPYFVMELVRGVKITDYCDEQNLSTQERLKLFMQVCQAIQHAHQKGIIHRDIKPSNILVTVSEPGAPGCPKVIDFGIAKATTGQRLTDKTVFTAFEQFIGTPAYMSPEQAMMTSLDIDTRTDIYALGVLLYELLTGQTPFDAKELMAAGLDAMRRIIREQEPARPSTRLSTMLAGELTTTAKHRQTDAPKLVHLLRGELDWIVMKALEKERSRRYETANGLARDVERFLANEPVAACPPSNLYRLQKLVRRNKGVFAAISAVAAALVIGLGLSTWLLFLEKAARQRAVAAERQANQARASEVAQRRQADEARANEAKLRVKAQEDEKKAQTEGSKSRQIAVLFKTMLQGVGPAKARGRDTTMLREILDKAAEGVGAELTNQAEVEVEMRLELAHIYDELALYPQMEKMARESLRVARAGLGEENESVAGSLSELGKAAMLLGHLDEAEILSRDALAMRKRILGEEDVAVARSLAHLADVLKEQGKLLEAETMYRQSLAMSRKLSGNEQPDVATSLILLANVLKEEGKTPEAEDLYREALAMTRRLFGNDYTDIAVSIGNLAIVLRENGKVSEAETMAREALAICRKLFGNEHPKVATSLGILADVLLEQGKLPEGEAMLRESLAMFKKLFGDEHADVASALTGLAIALHQQHRFAEAETLYREALAVRSKLLGNEHPSVADSLANLAYLLTDEGKLPEAETKLREALAVVRKPSANDPSQETDSVGGVLHHLAEVLRQRKALPEARLLAVEAAAMYQRHPGWPFNERDHAFEVLTDVFTDLGDLAGLEAILRAALEQQKKLLGSEHPDVAVSLGNLAQVLAGEDKLPEAEKTYREALLVLRKAPCSDPYEENSNLGVVLHHLAEVLREQKSLTEARPLAVEAALVYQRHPGWRPEERQHALQVLRDIFIDLGDLPGLEAFHRDALAQQRNLYGNEHPEVVESLNNLASVLRRQGKLADAETTYREALFLARKIAAQDPAHVASKLGVVLHHLADVLREQKKPLAEARSLAEEAVAVYQGHPEWPDEERDHASRVLVSVLTDLGDSDGVERWLRKVVAAEKDRAEDDPSRLESAIAELAAFFRREQKFTAAEPFWREALASARSFATNDAPRLEVRLADLGDCLRSQTRYAESESLYREAAASAWHTATNDASRFEVRLNDVVEVLQKQGKTAELERFFAEIQNPPPESQPLSANLLRGRAWLLAKHCRWKAAMADFSSLVASEPDNHEAYHALAPLLVQTGELQAYRLHCAQELAHFRLTSDPNTAERMAKDCLILRDSGVDLQAVNAWADTGVTAGKDSRDLPWFQLCKGLAEYRQEHFANAIDWTQKALSHEGEDLHRDLEACLVLAMAQYRSQQAGEACVSLAKGVEIAERKLPKLESGDLGNGWRDWIIARALLSEAKVLIEGQAN